MIYMSDMLIYAQVKELGAVVYDCSCLAKDLGKIFEAYWYLNQTETVPAHWPKKYSTLYNKDTPMQLSLNGSDASAYLSVREIRQTLNRLSSIMKGSKAKTKLMH